MLVAVVEWLLAAVVPMLAVFDCLLLVEVGNSFSGVHVHLALGIVAVAKVVLYIGINTFKSVSNPIKRSLYGTFIRNIRN